jgi:outer membrane protein insertion porin family
LGLNQDRVNELNGVFPQSDFRARAIIVGDTQAFRSSTGIELQVIMPVVNAPFRVYWAYNPNIVRTTIQPPVAVDPSMFPNYATYYNAVYANPLTSATGAPGVGFAYPYRERHSTFRFTIGRTF